MLIHPRCITSGLLGFMTLSSSGPCPNPPLKRELVQQAHVFSKQQILDLGCGTATLTILIKKMHSDANEIGLDGDRKILELGRRKAEKTKVDITLTQAMSFDLPYPDRFFDRVLSKRD